MNKNNTLPWVEKYRPHNLNEIVSHIDIISTLKQFINNRCLPHILFYGPPGTGKTSTIMACARELYGGYYNFMVMELNASDDRGIEMVRTKIKKFVVSDNVFFGETLVDRENIFKLVILDETDAMTDDAQAILRKIVEEYTYNTRFCLICNYIQKISPALQSRCTKFRFAPISDDLISKRVIKMAEEENIKISGDGITTLIKRSNGDMRKVINVLQSVSMSYDVINEGNINNILGYPQKEQILKIIDYLMNCTFVDSFNAIKTMMVSESLSLVDVVNEIHEILMKYILNDDRSVIKDMSISRYTMILDKIRDIEVSKSLNSANDIQLSALIGIFKL